MKVILTADVPKLGRKFDVKEVAGGFARNFLLPRKLVELATEAGLTSLEKRRQKVEALRVKKLEDLGVLLASLEGKRVTIVTKANEEGHLFAGIHKEEVQAVIFSELKIDAPLEAIHLEENIKELGEHEITLSVAEKEAKIVVVVERATN